MLSIFGMIVMLVDPLVDERSAAQSTWRDCAGGSGAQLWRHHLSGARIRVLAFWNMVQVDAFSVFFHFLVMAVTVVVILTSYEYMEVQQIRAGEYYG